MGSSLACCFVVLERSHHPLVVASPTVTPLLSIDVGAKVTDPNFTVDACLLCDFSLPIHFLWPKPLAPFWPLCAPRKTHRDRNLDGYFPFGPCGTTAMKAVRSAALAGPALPVGVIDWPGVASSLWRRHSVAWSPQLCQVRLRLRFLPIPWHRHFAVKAKRFKMG